MSRLESSFRDVYLQLISIIQGVAFGYLAAAALNDTNKKDAPEWVALALCLMTIITIWQEYVVGATAYAWIPTLLDAVIPFGLGIVEFALITFAHRSTHSFLIALLVTWSWGTVAQGNFLFYSRRGFDINKSSNRLMSRYVLHGTYLTAAGAVFIGILLLVRSFLLGDAHDSLLMALSLVIALPMFFRSIWQWNRPLNREQRRTISADRQK